MHLRDQLVERSCDVAPMIQPVAWKAQSDVGSAEHALVNACAGHGSGLTRAADKKLFGIAGDINEVFALEGGAGTKRKNGESVRAGYSLRFDVLRLNAVEPFDGWQQRAQGGHGHENASARGASRCFCR